MEWTLEVVVLPVSDIDRAVSFYRDQVGFRLDHDTRNEHMRAVQLTPPGSGCSIVFGDLPSQNQMEPGSMKALQLGPRPVKWCTRLSASSSPERHAAAAMAITSSGSSAGSARALVIDSGLM